jgi:hypothetical protein
MPLWLLRGEGMKRLIAKIKHWVLWRWCLHLSGKARRLSDKAETLVKKNNNYVTMLNNYHADRITSFSTAINQKEGKK